MKCRLLLEMDVINPAYNQRDHDTVTASGKPYRVPRFVKAPPGTQIDDPHCWRLVLLGVAEPADDECREAAGLTPEQIADRTVRYQRLAAGRGTGDAQYDAPPADAGSEDE